MTAISLNIRGRGPVLLRDVFPENLDAPIGVDVGLFEQVRRAAFVPPVPTTLNALKSRVKMLEKTCSDLQHPGDQSKTIAFLKTAFSLALLAIGILGANLLTGGLSVAVTVSAALALGFLHYYYVKDHNIGKWDLSTLVVWTLFAPFAPIWEAWKREKNLTDSIQKQKGDLENSVQSLTDYHRFHAETLRQAIDEKREKVRGVERAPPAVQLFAIDAVLERADLDACSKELDAVTKWLELFPKQRGERL
jgi:hypothetical protein